MFGKKKYSRIGIIGGATVLVAGFSLLVFGAEEPKGDAYPLATCIVSGKRLGEMGDAVIYDHSGREIRFCCKGCVKKFEGNAAEYLEKIDAAIIKDQLPRYPLETCVVSGEKLGGDMGEPINHVYKNRLIRFCCKGCVKEFAKDPGKFLALLDKAVVDKQKEDYPLETCVVSGRKLGSMGEPVDYVHANRLVRFCCKGCIQAFRKDPAKYTGKIDKAWGSETSSTHESEGSHEHGGPGSSGEESHGSGSHSGSHGSTHKGMMMCKGRCCG